MEGGFIAPDLIVINDLKYSLGAPGSLVEHEHTMAYTLGWRVNVDRQEMAVVEYRIFIDKP